MRLERILPGDLLDIAHENNLRGVKIHVLDGETRSLGKMSDAELAAFSEKAQRLQLDIHIETSSSDKQAIDHVTHIALKLAPAPSDFTLAMRGIYKMFCQKSLLISSI